MQEHGRRRTQGPDRTDVTSSAAASQARGSVWRWIPTLYFGQGIPYVAVMTLSVILYKNLGISNTDIALYTSWLYVPFVIKPLWSPFVDMFRSKRWWIVWLELLIGSAFALVALTFMFTLLYVIARLILEVLYVFLDPRVRYDDGRARAV